jgi:release factor glutamine methyltransferase
VDLVRWTTGYLAERGFEEPRLTAELLLAGTLGLRRLDLYLQFDRPLHAGELAQFKARLKRRLNREPLQYIEGVAQFRELLLQVDRRVLIPRPETELLVGEILSWTNGRTGQGVVDIGTGSGAIALSLAVEGRFARVLATDVSEGALDVARSNAERAGVADQVEFRVGSLFAPLAGERFDILVSNPPYIGESERAELSPEVVDWEPATALFAGGDGLDVVRELVRQGSDYLNPGGLLAMEIGSSQAAKVVEMVRENPAWDEPTVREDLAGRDRFVVVRRRA